MKYEKGAFFSKLTSTAGHFLSSPVRDSRETRSVIVRLSLVLYLLHFDLSDVVGRRFLSNLIFMRLSIYAMS